MGTRAASKREEETQTTKSRSETTKSDEEEEAEDNVTYAQSYILMKRKLVDEKQLSEFL